MNKETSSARSATAVQRPTSSARLRRGLSALLVALIAAAVTLSFSSAATAATSPAGLGTAGSYSVLGGETVTNTGPTSLSGDLGVSPGNAITGFPPGEVGGTIHAGDAEALQAQSDLVTAYDDVAGRAPTESVAGDLGGRTLVDGVYNSTGPLGLTGTLTLDGQGDPNSVFIFQVASTLITASSSNVSLINGAQACNVYWQVGSSATLGTGSTFVGSILALTSISVTNNATVQGRALARNGAVTLDSNVFTTTSCAPTPTPSPTDTESPTVPPTDTESPTVPPTESESPVVPPTDAESPTVPPTDVESPTVPPTDAESPTSPPAEADSPTPAESESPSPSPTPAESDSPTPTPTPTPTESESPSATLTESPGGPDSATDSDAPTGPDASDQDSTESAAPTGADAEDAGSAAGRSDLPATGPSGLTGVLVGLSALLLLGGAALLIIRHQRSESSE